MTCVNIEYHYYIKLYISYECRAITKYTILVLDSETMKRITHSYINYLNDGRSNDVILRRY